MSTSNYSAVVCLVGARLLSRHDQIRYTDWIFSFQQCVKDRASLGADGCTYFFLGEYCYITAHDIHSLLATVGEVRLTLLQQQVYSNAVLTDKSCGIDQYLYTHAGDKAEKDVDNLKLHYFGINFFSDSSHLRPEIEEMRAIGCSILADEVRSQYFSSNIQFVSNVNISTNNHRVDIFLDMAFEEDAFAENILRNIIEDFFYFTAFSKSISRFFIPFFLNLVQSLELNAFAHKIRILKVLSSPQFIGKLNQTIGAEYVIFKLLHLTIVETEREPDDVQSASSLKGNRASLTKFIFSKATLLDKLDSLPEFVMPRQLRQKLVADYAKVLYQNIHSASN
ncbi:hypothetical protein A5320_03830 [Rheinheimera sp. SA_1]|uniref:hypothetical protein n=1 Tax=Rheinheimera sp. SA_1 TaxID=1827365 RepID=UPI0007FB754F|nr:hypothetical protein [Rheinheimera sp. SA_1]OBP16536.1 hypothetical protein A5320_03830 [Rheinheimera sp. SA_1]